MHSCIYKQVKTSLKWSLVIFRLLVPWKEKNSAFGLNLSCVCCQALFLLQTAVQWGILFCFPLWVFGGHLTCETGEEAQFLVRKVDPTTTQIMMDVTALAHVQFKFWLCLFQCPSNSDVGGKSELVFIYLFIYLIFPVLEMCNGKTFWERNHSEDNPCLQRWPAWLFATLFLHLEPCYILLIGLQKLAIWGLTPSDRWFNCIVLGILGLDLNFCSYHQHWHYLSKPMLVVTLLATFSQVAFIDADFKITLNVCYRVLAS